MSSCVLFDNGATFASLNVVDEGMIQRVQKELRKVNVRFFAQRVPSQGRTFLEIGRRPGPIKREFHISLMYHFRETDSWTGGYMPSLSGSTQISVCVDRIPPVSKRTRASTVVMPTWLKK